jgi:aminoglycoside 6-adenylyltransferase
VRTEKEMMQLILGFAEARDDVRAVVMTGSRTNPTAAQDPFQDYDITYLVESVAPYRQNGQVPQYFGDIMILQTPDDMGEAASPTGSYAFLMQFMDGNRIDLTFRALDDTDPILADSLSLVLMDKDRRFALPEPSLRSYVPQKPTAKQFADCCNEFWWLNPYVAKGLYRDQLTYAKTMLDGLMREQLMAMLTWYIGLTTDFRVSVGYFGRHLKTHVARDVWELVERTYPDARPDHIWQALFAMNQLFRRVARPTAEVFGFAYPEREDAAVSLFVRQIRDSAAGSTAC